MAKKHAIPRKRASIDDRIASLDAKKKKLEVYKQIRDLKASLKKS